MLPLPHMASSPVSLPNFTSAHALGLPCFPHLSPAPPLLLLSFLVFYLPLHFITTIPSASPFFSSPLPLFILSPFLTTPYFCIFLGCCAFTSRSFTFILYSITIPLLTHQYTTYSATSTSQLLSRLVPPFYLITSTAPYSPNFLSLFSRPTSTVSCNSHPATIS